ncbi:MAG: DinB family protein, partial [Planctomycetota bacterium]
MTEEEWRACPHQLNSLAWTFWHLARVEDGCISIIVAGEMQLFDTDRAAALRIDRHGDGEGMSRAEVAELSAAIDLSALRAYRDEVGRRTREHARTLHLERWNEPIGEADVQAAIEAGI